MAHGFNEEELKRIKEVFKQFDLDGDGEITISELSTVLKRFGQEYSAEDLKEIISSVDIDGSGTIGFEEFLELVRFQAENSKATDELFQAFSVFDRDGNGYISSCELKYAIKALCPGVTEQEVHELVIEADSDRDGQISYEEFSKLLIKH